MTVALFPGQGVQAPGMQAGLETSRAFQAASDVLSIDVLELCREGNTGSADLTSTRWAQPAVLACSVASFELFERASGGVVVVAGHSIGEYAALVAAGALALPDAVALVALRAEATEAAAEAIAGGMTAVMRVDREVVEQICERAGASLAADNSAGQFVISGPLDAVDAARDLLSAEGAKCRVLDVAGAFHSPVMSGAIGPVAEALARVEIAAPRIDLWSPTTATPVSDPVEIKQILVDQLTSPVLWRETIERIGATYDPDFVDIGPGRVVGGLAKRIVDGARISYAADLVVADGRPA